MKQPKKPTRRDKKKEYSTARAYKEAKRKKAGQELNQELNKVASSILKNTQDLDPEFSKTVDENFWELV